jgi:hypothetical protein
METPLTYDYEPGVTMSKIPQGEWNAIAARYAKGESISRIAQSYSCTPPAIHYILKRNKQRTAQSVQPVNGRLEPPSTLTREMAQVPLATDRSRLAEPGRAEHGASRSAPDASKEGSGQMSGLWVGPDRDLAATSDRSRAAVPQQQLGTPRNTGRASAFAAGLDRELHGRAEAAIEAFRSSFDAALAEGSPVVRERLRQAASDLMRVAARTTIVLDRLNASAERASRAQDHLRSAPPREHA